MPQKKTPTTVLESPLEQAETPTRSLAADSTVESLPAMSSLSSKAPTLVSPLDPMARKRPSEAETPEPPAKRIATSTASDDLVPAAQSVSASAPDLSRDETLGGYSSLMATKGVQGFLAEGDEQKPFTPVLRSRMLEKSRQAGHDLSPLFDVERKGDAQMTCVLVDGWPNSAFHVQCSDYHDNVNIVDAVVSLVNEFADHVIQCVYATSEHGANVLWNSDLFSEWLQRRLKNPDASKWHLFLAQNEAYRLVPVLIGANDYHHRDRQEASRMSPPISYVKGEPFFTFTVVDRTEQ
ncbi:uncharacterized protein JCM15063_005227 [Sporobolomyces koalae]|uniref:uncharacterized protein n=1 Tax=Sporobolomyces koalae TaxID=500713 RepID=UPI0031714F28